MQFGYHKCLSIEIHRTNREAGWWTDLETGKPLNRNFGEMIALIHSELSECYEGRSLDKYDDHLPEFPMYQVELADACIRIYDLLGGMFMDVPEFCEFRLDFPVGWLTAEDRLLSLHYFVSQALENFRKGGRPKCKMFLYRALDACHEWAENDGFDLDKVLRVKWEYNKNRADHKIENRKLEGGKKI